MLGNISHIDKYFGMIASRKILRRSLRVATKEVVMRTWILLVRQRMENERVPTRSVIVMEDHHNQGRRRN